MCFYREEWATSSLLRKVVLGLKKYEYQKFSTQWSMKRTTPYFSLLLFCKNPCTYSFKDEQLLFDIVLLSESCRVLHHSWARDWLI